ncbi:MAG: tRNA (adenosine(37)-N6)-dimethylallyltransferase MiaA [Bdellovibrionales bacterium RIFOXYD1_FULL_44_7]|nr:MAG: tRNA (adenosine(37)-N6)-dimethylallyltransferase MiaA [Bdellovibrionales bacterium RIFOXYD1_FULL_44_7]
MSSIAIISGPTATGKTSVALDFCQSAGGIEIINADSMLVYRGMDIGTAKPSSEELQRVPHHLINIRNPDEPFTAGDFVREADKAIEEIQRRNKKALIVGGTGFYLKALLFGLWPTAASNAEVRRKLEILTNETLYSELDKRDHKTAEKVGKNDRYRLVRAMEIIELTGKSPSDFAGEQKNTLSQRYKLILIDRETTELEQRIKERTNEMLDRGLIEEVKLLLETFPNTRALNSVGYKQTKDFLSGIKPPGRKIEEGTIGLRNEIVLATRQLVKRQRTWFKSQKEEESFILDKEKNRLVEFLKQFYGA